MVKVMKSSTWKRVERQYNNVIDQLSIAYLVIESYAADHCTCGKENEDGSGCYPHEALKKMEHIREKEAIV